MDQFMQHAHALSKEARAMSMQIVTETPIAGYVAPALSIVSSSRRRAAQRAEGGLGTVFQLPPRAAWSPAINVFDTGDAFVIIAELAGVGPDSLRIELDVTTDTVTLRGTRLGGAPTRTADYDSMDEEITSGRFERAISLGQPVDGEGAKATCRYGLLELMLPKLKTRAPKREPLMPPLGQGGQAGRVRKRRAIAC